MDEPDIQFELRPLAAADCQAVSDLLQEYAKDEILLWRTPEDILAHLECFRVAVADGTVGGCVALHDYGNGLIELRSLAVARHLWGRGCGRALVSDAVAAAAEGRNIRVFALTLRVDFFENCGFTVGDKLFFPEKVWSDCQYCHKRDRCDETAVYIDL
jgi:amino-acid N-acetyltransferase